VAAFGFGIVWFGYSLTGWGYMLIKGYDVKFTDWINPLHPFVWPKTFPKIPSTQLLPGGSTSTSTSTTKPKAKKPPVTAV
jgi:hypothetical protein